MTMPHRQTTFSKHSLRKLLIIILCSATVACEKASYGPSTLYFSAKTIGPSVNIYSADSNDQITKRTDDERWRDLELDVSVNGDLIFVSNRTENPKIDMAKRTENFDIFLQMKGQPFPTKIYEGPGLEVQPKFSPNGKIISYVSRNSGNQQLSFLVPGREEPLEVLSSKEVASYAWSPDSTQVAIAYNDDTHSYIDVVQVADLSSKTLQRILLESPADSAPATDADNYQKQFAYVSWSPAADKIAFIRHPRHRGTRQLWVMPLEGEPQLVSPPDAQVQDSVSWNSAGDHLLYSALLGYKFYWDEASQRKIYEGGMHIFEYQVGGTSKQLTKHDHMFKNPTYSPDEKQIAYLYAEELGAREYQLFRMARDGSNPVEVFNDVSPMSSLIWHSDLGEE
ncbi:TolB family protein [Teredinibacter turnerae]|uniref:TolB family protein n=1 Tax=Teredinibacter turnerae TaxID=2426 RepID=UPI00036E0DE5|nr:PD40 domain-containing protein [Teredinibacter turnerae]